MRALIEEKEKAVALRKQGLSYRDIRAQVPVSKSSISVWLQNLPLTDEEKRYLKTRTDSNISRGRIKAATSNRHRRLVRDEALRKQARIEFDRHFKLPFFQLGIALYWAEGAKRHSGFGFTNSDWEMIDFMLLWVEKFFGISRRDIRVRLYIHKPYAHENCEGFWSRKIGVPLCNFQKTIYKPTGLLVKKRPNYKGCLRIEISKTVLLRKMIFWQSMLVDEYRKR
jgi:hypothetical protein